VNSSTFASKKLATNNDPFYVSSILRNEVVMAMIYRLHKRRRKGHKVLLQTEDAVVYTSLSCAPTKLLNNNSNWEKSQEQFLWGGLRQIVIEIDSSLFGLKAFPQVSFDETPIMGANHIMVCSQIVTKLKKTTIITLLYWIIT